MSTNWADFGIDISISNLTEEERLFYNSGGTYQEDRYGREKKFPQKRGKWISKVEWTADIEPLPPFDPIDFIQLIECDKKQK